MSNESTESVDYPEFTDEQLRRIDEIENAAQSFLYTIAESNDIPWRLDDIWGLIEVAACALKESGRRVRIPTRVTEKDGRMYITEWYGEYDSDADVERE